MQDLSSLALNVSAILPELVMVFAAILVMFVDMFTSQSRQGLSRAIPWVALLGVALAALASGWLWTKPPVTFQGMAISDHFALTVNFIVLTACALGILLSVNAIPLINQQSGAYYALLLLATSGMMMMGSSTDLITAFLALEIFSLALYIMTGLHRTNSRSTEASMKYVLLGAFASSFFAYGAALIYGATGSTRYSEIAGALAGGQGNLYLLYFGLALLVVGFGFKIGLVPFHMWTPDVYQGAPTPVTAFMSAATKTAGFAAFLRLLLVALPAHQEAWSWALAGLAVLTMTWGNFAALRQTSLKRMLAYSSVAHAGYVLVALAPGTNTGANAALFYLFTYAFMNIGAFAVVIALEQAGENDALRNRAAGIADRWPLLAFTMSVFMFSLAGIPPLAGFFGKLFVFQAAVDGGFTWLAAIGMLNSAVAAYYYLRVVVAMYFEPTTAESAQARPTWSPLRVGVFVAAALTLVIGIYPTIWANLFAVSMGG
jgi:NADH-quinone oxidoreductase subunit N